MPVPSTTNNNNEDELVLLLTDRLSKLVTKFNDFSETKKVQDLKLQKQAGLIANVMEENALLNRTNTKIIDRFELFERKYIDLEKENQYIKSQIKNLEQRNVSLKKTSLQNEEQIQEYINKESQLLTKIETINNELLTARNESKDLQERLIKLGEQKQGLSERINTIDRLYKESDKDKAKYEELNAQLLKEKSLQDKKHTSLTSKITTIEKENNKFKEELTRLKENEDIAQAQLRTLSPLNKTYATEIENLKRENIDKKKYQELTAQLQRDKSLQETKLASLISKVTEIEKEKKQYKNELTILKENENAAQAKLQTLSPLNKTYATEIENLRKENLEKRKYEELNAQLLQDKALQDKKLTSLTSKIAEIEKEKNQYKDQLTTLQETEVMAQKQLSSLSPMNKAFSNKIEVMKDQTLKINKKYEQKITVLNKKIAEIRLDKKVAEDNLSKTVHEKEKFIEKYNDLATKQEHLQKKLTENQNRENDLTAQILANSQKNDKSMQTLPVKNILTNQEFGTYEKNSKIRKYLEEQLKEEISDNKLILKKYSDHVVVTFQGDMLFASGSAQLENGVVSTIDKLGEILKGLDDVTIEVQGHTDNVKVSSRNKRYRNNWELSSARASNVAEMLIRQKRLDPRNISATGKAEYMPLAENSSGQGKAKNRRIEVILKPKKNETIESSADIFLEKRL